MANRLMNQFLYSFHKKPTLLTTKFTVLATNAAGCTGFAPGTGTFAGGTTTANFGRGIAQVYMNSSSAAADNFVASANLQVKFSDPWKNLLGYTWSASSVVTGSAINLTTGLTAGTMYQIVTVGTSTQANWNTAGLPAGIVPAVGQQFIAITSAAGTGTGTVKALAASGITSVEPGGDPANLLNPAQSQVLPGAAFGAAGGGQLIFNLYRTATLQQPANGTVITMSFLMQG